MFARSQGPMPGIDLGFPDVCLTPALVPVPIPYPNIAMTTMAIPNISNQFIMAMPVHNLMTMVSMTNGDQAGVNGGVASGMIMGPSRHLMGSTNIIKGTAPATKMLSMTGQNGMAPNTVGTALSPSQTKVMHMR